MRKTQFTYFIEREGTMRPPIYISAAYRSGNSSQSSSRHTLWSDVSPVFTPQPSSRRTPRSDVHSTLIPPLSPLFPLFPLSRNTRKAPSQSSSESTLGSDVTPVFTPQPSSQHTPRSDVHSTLKRSLSDPQLSSQSTPRSDVHPTLTQSSSGRTLGSDVTPVFKATAERRYPHHQYDDDYPDICFLAEQLRYDVDSKGGYFAPTNLGISLEVPANAVPAGKTITLCGRPCLCGPFQYPEGYESLSAVYLITSKGSFKKEVKLKMKHYGRVETEEQADQMCFLSAKCTPVSVKGKNIYDFAPINGGKFAVHNEEGSLTLEHFCFITSGTNASIGKKYCALFSKSKMTTGLQHAVLSISLDNDVYIKNFYKIIKEDHEMEVPQYEGKLSFLYKVATIEVPPAPEGWSVVPSRQPFQFTQERVDKPKSVGEIAYPPRITFEFEFNFNSTAETIPTSSIYMFQVLGMSTELNFPCRLRPTQSVSGAEEPKILDICDLQQVQELLVDVKKEWHPLGLALGLKQPALQEIEQNKDDIESRKREMVTQWLNQVDNVQPTYASLEAALRNVTVKCVAVANTVHKYYAQPK